MYFKMCYGCLNFSEFHNKCTDVKSCPFYADIKLKKMDKKIDKFGRKLNDEMYAPILIEELKEKLKTEMRLILNN